MTELERFLLFASLVVCALSSIFHIVGWIFEKTGLFRIGKMLVWIFFCAVTITIAVRWIEQGHGPYITMYEVLLSNVWIAILLYLFITWRKKALEVLGVFVMPVIFLTMGVVIMAPSQSSNLTPSYRSVWLILHVLFAKLAFGSLIMAFALAVSLLLKRYIDAERHEFIKRLVDSDKADDFSYKFVVSGFVFATIMIAAGSIWANQLWGKYWGWDSIEVWSLVTWLVFGLYLHMRITYKFSGVPAAFYVIAAFIICVISFFIMPYLGDTIHNSFMFKK